MLDRAARAPVGRAASASISSHCSSSASRRAQLVLATPSAAVRTMTPWPAGRTSSTILRSRRRSSSARRLEMPKRGGVGDEHDESPGQRHLLGQAGALGPDRVLRHLAQDGLAGPQHVLDPGWAVAGASPIVVPVVLHVAPVEHGVLRRADVDERRLHAGQHILHPAPVDVAVDLVGLVGGPAPRSARSASDPRAPTIWVTSGRTWTHTR